MRGRNVEQCPFTLYRIVLLRLRKGVETETLRHIVLGNIRENYVGKFHPLALCMVITDASFFNVTAPERSPETEMPLSPRKVFSSSDCRLVRVRIPTCIDGELESSHCLTVMAMMSSSSCLSAACAMIGAGPLASDR